MVARPLGCPVGQARRPVSLWRYHDAVFPSSCQRALRRARARAHAQAAATCAPAARIPLWALTRRAEGPRPRPGLEQARAPVDEATQPHGFRHAAAYTRRAPPLPLQPGAPRQLTVIAPGHGPRRPIQAGAHVHSARPPTHTGAAPRRARAIHMCMPERGPHVRAATPGGRPDALGAEPAGAPLHRPPLCNYARRRGGARTVFAWPPRRRVPCGMPSRRACAGSRPACRPRQHAAVTCSTRLVFGARPYSTGPAHRL